MNYKERESFERLKRHRYQEEEEEVSVNLLGARERWISTQVLT